MMLSPQQAGLLAVCLMVIGGVGFLGYQVMSSPVRSQGTYDVPMNLSPAEMTRLAEVGAKIFVIDGCATACHTVGSRVAPPLANLSSRYDLRTLPMLLANPPPPMPRFPYTEDDRRALSVYLLQNY